MRKFLKRFWGKFNRQDPIQIEEKEVAAHYEGKFSKTDSLTELSVSSEDLLMKDLEGTCLDSQKKDDNNANVDNISLRSSEVADSEQDQFLDELDDILATLECGEELVSPEKVVSDKFSCNLSDTTEIKNNIADKASSLATDAVANVSFDFEEKVILQSPRFIEEEIVIQSDEFSGNLTTGKYDPYIEVEEVEEVEEESRTSIGVGQTNDFSSDDKSDESEDLDFDDEIDDSELEVYADELTELNLGDESPQVYDNHLSSDIEQSEIDRLLEEQFDSYDSFLSSAWDDLDEDVAVEEKNDWCIERNVTPELRIAQLVDQFIDNIDCSEAYYSILENIFWGVGNRHVLKEGYIVRRSPAQEKVLAELITIYNVTPYELELIYALKQIWMDNHCFWSVAILSRKTKEIINIEHNHKNLSWKVAARFIQNLPFLSDEVLIEEFLLSLYHYWYQVYIIRPRKRISRAVDYTVFQDFLKEIVRMAEYKEKEMEPLLRGYNSWFEEISGESNCYFWEPNRELNILQELDLYEQHNHPKAIATR